MRTISFICAFAILFLGPSLAGTSETGNLPGIGTFDFAGSAPLVAAPPMLVASIR